MKKIPVLAIVVCIWILPLNVEAKEARAGVVEAIADAKDVPVMQEGIYPQRGGNHNIWHEETWHPDPINDLSDEELDLFARCVYAEAGNQGLIGMRMVACVILNQVDHDGFPDTITDVITAPYHFSSYWDGGMYRHTPTDDAYEAIRLELEERSYPELLFFTAGDYSAYGTPYMQVGDHYFSIR